MKKFQYDISIEGKTETEADAKMKALTTLACKLSQVELTNLAHIVKHVPVPAPLP